MPSDLVSLESLYEFTTKFVAAKSATPTYTLWQFLTTYDETNSYTEGFQNIKIAIQCSRKLIESHSEPDVFLEPIIRLENSWNEVSLVNPINAFPFEDSDSKLLKAALVASKYLTQRHLDPAKLDELQQKLEGLEKEIVESDLDEDLKSFLIRGLDDLRRAIHEYRWRGSDGLEDAFSIIYGRALREAKEHEGNQQFTGFLVKMMEIDLWLGLAPNLAQLPATITFFSRMLGNG